MSKRWKPEVGDYFWCISWDLERVNQINFVGFSETDSFIKFNCFKTREEAEAAAEKVKALLLSLHDEPVTICNGLPKLTAEVFNRPDCPEWAKWAAVDYSGIAFFYEDKPFFTGTCYQNIGKAQVIDSNIKWGTTEPQNNLIERPAKLPDWCKVGEWVYCTQTENYGKILSVDAEQVNIRLSSNETFSAKTNMMLKYGKAARLRPYNADEMKALVGRVVNKKDGDVFLVTAYTPVLDSRNLSAVDIDGMWVMPDDVFEYFTIDNKPCGKLEHLENGEWVE